MNFRYYLQQDEDGPFGIIRFTYEGPLVVRTEILDLNKNWIDDLWLFDKYLTPSKRKNLEEVPEERLEEVIQSLNG